MISIGITTLAMIELSVPSPLHAEKVLTIMPEKLPAPDDGGALGEGRGKLWGIVSVGEQLRPH